MAIDPANSSGSSRPVVELGEVPPREKLKRQFKTVWPLPALVIGACLFIGGTVVAWQARPKPDPTIPLRRAESLVEARQFERAIDSLNSDVKRFMDKGAKGGVTVEHRKAYHLAMARAFSGAQSELGFSRPENHQVVVNQFARAEELGAHIHGPDVTRLVESLLALDRLEEALVRVRELPRVGGTSGAHGPSAPAHAPDSHASGHDAHPASPSSEHAASDGHGADDAHDAHGHSHATAHATLPPSPEDAANEAQRRIRLTKLVVEANLKARKPRDELTLELLAELGGFPNLSAEDRAWVLARQAELLLAGGRPEDAIVKLLRRIRIATSGEELPKAMDGELYLLLGRAYFAVGDGAAAMKQLDAARGLLSEGTPKLAEAELLLGRINQSDGNLADAKGHFAIIADEYSTTPSYLPALLGLAEVEGAVVGTTEGEDAGRELESSIQRYAQIVDMMNGGAQSREVTRERVAESLLERHQDRFQAGDLMSALRFAQLAESMFRENEVPGRVHISLARTHRRIADETMAAARDRGGPDFKIADLNPVERTEIKQHYLAGADHYREFAATVATTDNRLYSESLWSAADSYDLAGDLEEAKKVFSAYAEGASDDDPRKPEARFRLAQAFEAQKDYPSAAALYKGLRLGEDGTGRRGAGSLWGDRSIVPLARCLLADNLPENDEEAESLLQSVVDGSIVSPEAAEFRESLVELGRMYYNRGDFTRAIERCDEAIGRYPNDARASELRYRLADSLRLSAAQIQEQLKVSLPQSTRQELEQTRTERLREAIDGYAEVRTALEKRPAERRTELERIYLRNAYFYAGDCAFDLGDYGSAVKAYDAARQRYSDEPASLVAMVQIVNAYVAQGQWAEARTANERAAQHLARFPESVWNRPDLPMERRHWDKWLEARTLLDQNAAASEE